MQMTHAAWVALLLLTIPSAWAINKCTQPDGKVVYQDDACPSNAKATAIKTAPGPLTREDELRAAAKACGMDKLPRFPEVGWSEETFLRCSEIATELIPRINETTTASGVSKQYVYRYHAGYANYVYVRNGKVTAIQN